MVRAKKERKIGKTSAENMTKAVNLVIKENYSLRRAADYVPGVSFQTLQRYVKKMKNEEDSNSEDIRMCPNYSVRQIFSSEQEHDLAHYVDTCSKMCFGFSTKGLRRLAYEMGEKNNLKMPHSWQMSKCAGLEWMRGFLQRNKHLRIRKPEACSLSRMTSFNVHNVNTFFTNLKKINERCPQLCNGSRIFNLDETGLTTVQQPKNVIAHKGVKQINQCTSAERGELVTIVGIISASGTFLPPVMVFPRKHFKLHMLNGAPTNTLGLAGPSGWMTSELFPRVMEHFIKYSHSSKENPSLLLSDNHESHMSIEVLDMAKEAGVTMLTLPPHCSHKMQPLDVAVFGPLKSYYNAAVDSWMMRNPGVPMTVYQVAECAGEAFNKSMTTNITHGFKKSGIFPYDSYIFQDEDFIAASVTDRPVTEEMQQNPSGNTGACNTENTVTSFDSVDLEVDHSYVQASKTDQCATASTSTSAYLSPKDFRGYPKAQPRKKKGGGRPKGRSIILTDTTDKAAIEAKKLEKEHKKHKQEERKAKRSARALFASHHAKKDSSDEEDLQVFYDDSSDGMESFSSFKDLERNPTEGDYILVRFPNDVFYVAKVLTHQDNDGDYDVSYLRKSNKVKGFIMPNIPDLATVNISDIMMLLPTPLQMRTKRLSGYIQFPVTFGLLDVR